MTLADDAVLALLDRRGRAAATALRERIDAVVERPTAPAVRRPAPGDPIDSPAERPDEVALLDDRRAGDGRRPPPGWLVGAAAAVAAAVVVAGVGLALRDDRQSSMTGGGPPAYLVPDWVPPGLGLTAATRPAPHPEFESIEGEVTVYGDGAADDPWSGPTLQVMVADQPLDGEDGEDGEPITVQGRPAVLSTSGTEVTIVWGTDEGRVLVRGRGGLTRDQVLAAAEGVVDGATVEASALPDGFTVLASGPLEAAMGPAALGYAGAADMVALAYGDGGTGPAIGLVQRAGRPESVDLLRIQGGDSRATEVRGHHAVLVRADGAPEITLQWLEPSGLLVTLSGDQVSEEDLRRVAESLRPARPGEIDALAGQADAGSSASPGESVSGEEVRQNSVDGSFAAPELGGIVLAAGEHEGQQWRLVLGDDGEYRTVELWYRGSSGGVGWPRDEPAPPLVTGMSSGGTWTGPVVYGVVQDGLAVTVELPGAEPITADLPRTDGVAERGFVVFLPEGLPEGTEFAVVARDASGAEVAREPEIHAPVPEPAAVPTPAG